MHLPDGSSAMVIWSESRMRQYGDAPHFNELLDCKLGLKTVFRWKLKQVDWKLTLKNKKKMIIKLREKQRKNVWNSRHSGT